MTKADLAVDADLNPSDSLQEEEFEAEEIDFEGEGEEDGEEYDEKDDDVPFAALEASGSFEEALVNGADGGKEKKVEPSQSKDEAKKEAGEIKDEAAAPEKQAKPIGSSMTTDR